jgi:hypothetical protein
MQFLPKNATAMTVCIFLQFCVISIPLQSFITVPVSHVKQQLGCSAYCVVLCCVVLCCVVLCCVVLCCVVLCCVV